MISSVTKKKLSLQPNYARSTWEIIVSQNLRELRLKASSKSGHARVMPNLPGNSFRPIRDASGNVKSS